MGREVEKVVNYKSAFFQAWKGMEFSDWVGKNNDIKNISII